MNDKLQRIDGIKWWITTDANGTRIPTPICPNHDLRLRPILPKIYNAAFRKYYDGSSNEAIELECAEGPHLIKLPRKYLKEQLYVIDRIDAKVFRGMSTLNLDDEAVPLAKDESSSKDNKYFVTAQLMESKRGLQLVVYAGEKGSKKKSQIFVEPQVRRLAFDQKDLHPSDVFVELNAVFEDGTKQKIERISSN